MRTTPTDRRTFLARLGILGAVAGSSFALPATASAALLGSGTALPAGHRARPLDDLVATLARQIVEALNRDTFSAVAAFVVPGQDPYSRAQGTPRSEPGAIEARTPEFLITFYDSYVALPPELVRGLASAMADGLADVPVRLPDGLPVLLPGVLEALDDAVRLMLRDQHTLPLSTVITLLLNLVATQVNPASVVGAFRSPFARLSHGEKAFVVSILEGPDLPLVTAIEQLLPEPLHGSISGLVRFLAGSLLEMAAFGSYSEWSRFDRRTRRVRGRPVGWRISGFDPGVLDGWNDLKGYYQGRKEVENA